ncbi:MAG: glycosyltransferase family 4 protein [Gammaproteobacteria bacterium]|nr:glycosyltransferase family 4 protein [Gammaproteobacteria bacterium]
MLSIEQALDCNPKTAGRLRVAILADIPRDATAGRANGRGGGHNFTWLPQLADAFARQSDLDAWWISYEPDLERAEVFRDAGQHFVKLPLSSISLGLALGLAPYRVELARLLRRLAPDVVHAWGTERVYPAVLPASPAPSVLSMQGILTEYARIGCLPRSWKWHVLAWHEPKWLRAADIVTCESIWGLDRIRAYVAPERTRRVDYGVHPSFYDVEWQPDPAKPVALFCGSLDRRKGVDLLLAALRRLPGRNWECRIAGEGPLRPLIERDAPANVRLLGTLAWDRLKAEYARAWCVVLPTLADTSPNVVKEGRVIGLPVVTTPYGGQRDYIHDGENGLIVDPHDSAALARALDGLMSSYAKARRMGAAHHQRDRNALRPERTAREFLDIYRHLAEENAGVTGYARHPC